MKKIWMLPGSPGWMGTAGDEYGRKTYFVGIPGQVCLIYAGRFFTYKEILAASDGDTVIADRFMTEFANNIREHLTKGSQPSYLWRSWYPMDG